MRDPNLLAWQWNLYPLVHRERANLLVHLCAVPVFLAGNVTLLLAPWSGGWRQALAGLVAMALGYGVQARMHKGESARGRALDPFEGPFDLLGRLSFEQWVNFPRFVLSGGFVRAWRESARPD